MWRHQAFIVYLKYHDTNMMCTAIFTNNLAMWIFCFKKKNVCMSIFVIFLISIYMWFYHEFVIISSPSIVLFPIDSLIPHGISLCLVMSGCWGQWELSGYLHTFGGCQNDSLLEQAWEFSRFFLISRSFMTWKILKLEHILQFSQFKLKYCKKICPMIIIFRISLRSLLSCLRETWSPFYKHGLTRILAWISNYIHLLRGVRGVTGVVDSYSDKVYSTQIDTAIISGLHKFLRYTKTVALYSWYIQNIGRFK